MTKKNEVNDFVLPSSLSVIDVRDQANTPKRTSCASAKNRVPAATAAAATTETLAPTNERKNYCALFANALLLSLASRSRSCCAASATGATR